MKYWTSAWRSAMPPDEQTRWWWELMLRRGLRLGAIVTDDDGNLLYARRGSEVWSAGNFYASKTFLHELCLTDPLAYIHQYRPASR